MAKAVVPKVPKKVSSKKKAGPTLEQIQKRAYEIYLERNGAPGDPMQDWLRAEQDLTAKPKKKIKVVEFKTLVA